MNPRNFFVELKRLDVYKVAVAYAVVASLLIQQVFPFFDRKTPFLEYGEMKTTLDLPDELMREVKIRAVHENKKLFKYATAELLQKGMAADGRRRGKLPKPVKLRGGAITAEEIEAAINWGRDWRWC